MTQLIFDRAKENMGRGTKVYKGYDQIRKSIFGGIAFCGLCGYSLCSCGTVYKGEREKYWYLSCTHMRKDIENPCSGVRINYADLCELVRQDLNNLIQISDMDLKTLVKRFVDESDLEAAAKRRATEKSKAEKRIVVIEKMIAKMYADNINGLIDDAQLNNVIASLNQETASLQELLKRIEADSQPDNTAVRFRQFFQMAKQYATIDVLDREALLTFVERIEVGPKILPEGTQMTSHRNQPFRQSVRIVYKFIGDIARDTVYQFPKTC